MSLLGNAWGTLWCIHTVIKVKWNVSLYRVPCTSTGCMQASQVFTKESCCICADRLTYLCLCRYLLILLERNNWKLIKKQMEFSWYGEDVHREQSLGWLQKYSKYNYIFILASELYNILQINKGKRKYMSYLSPQENLTKMNMKWLEYQSVKQCRQLDRWVNLVLLRRIIKKKTS